MANTKRATARPAGYSSWCDMRSRCHNHKVSNYQNYGGRGIKVCPRWRSFSKFIADMGPPPPGHSLDRIDNNGDYEPGNCRWAARATQSRNTRRNVWVNMNGQRLCIKDACRAVGHTFQALRHLQRRRGWDAQTVVDAWVHKREHGLHYVLPVAA